MPASMPRNPLIDQDITSYGPPIRMTYLYPGDHADPVHEAEEDEPGVVGGGVEDEREAAGADGAEAPQQLEDDAQPRQDEAVQVARPDVLVERRKA